MSTAFPNEPTGATVLLDHNFNNFSPFYYGGASLDSDATAPISPPVVARSTLRAGQRNGGTQMNWLTPGGTLYRDMFIGLTWRTNPEFQGRGANNKMFFVKGPNSHGFFGMYGTMSGGTNQILFSHNDAGADNSHACAADLGLLCYPNVSSGTVYRGVWHKIEAYVKASTTMTSRDGIFRWWVNGVLAGNYTNINYASAGLNEWIWTETWDGCGGYPVCDLGTVNTTDWSHYIDHLYISTGGTGSGGSGGGGGGGGGGTPQVLPAPGNLYPNGVTLPYGETTFSWGAVSGASNYAVRIHKIGEPYEPTSNYLAFVTQAGTSIVRTTQPGSQYDWWVHAVNSAGDLGPSNGALLTTSGSPVPPPPDPDPQPDPPPPPPVEPPPVEPPPVVIPPVDPTDPATLPPEPLPTPQVLGTATVIVTVKDRQNPIKKEFHFYG